ncbi:zeaxanthin epoxidase, chloroplastic [Manihot esculenta]|uniref:FHA domain-containing protein n=1 Tax=Manihot esculenta TaxID=3983 RepID=A0A2C9VB27_MANES|nr:zeaxanthin epoxidase, chloroplastic [Manihot esculenta]OAY41557.1 hypothetical protein MANES_09G111800v8 [Manihot esculenta]
MDVTARSLSQAKLPAGCSTSVSPTIFHSKPSILAQNSIALQSPKIPFSQLQVFRIKARKQRILEPVHASESEISSTDVQDRWLLQPVGDGDTRHIGYKMKMPDAFEIASSEVTVGRLPEKADVVIPVATVSGIHARIQKKEGNLLVTDLDSTNGTYIDDKRLKPGVAANVPSGSLLTFGDIHLAMFRVSKLENVESASKPEESEEKAETSSPIDSGGTS